MKLMESKLDNLQKMSDALMIQLSEKDVIAKVLLSFRFLP